MFYSETILLKKGPLAKIWLAAHWDKKLSKSQFLQTNIKQTVNAIVNQDQIPIALRLSGQLLLGVVKVYSRKTRYLLEDCNDALIKIKMTFRQGNVDLPVMNNTNISLQSTQLVLPETITEFDLLIPDPTFNIMNMEENIENFNYSHISKKQDITLISAFEPSIEIGRGSQLNLIDDPLIQMDSNEKIDLDLGVDENDNLQNDISIEIGRDHAPEPHFSREFSDIINQEKDVEIRDMSMEVDMNNDLNIIESNDIHNLEPATEISIDQLEIMDQDNELVLEDREGSVLSSNNTLRSEILEFSELRVGTSESEDRMPRPKNQSRYKKILEDSVTEISSKEFSSQLRNTSHITKQNRLLSSDPVFLTLTQHQTYGKFAAHIFQPLNIHPTIVSLLNPTCTFPVQINLFKRKRVENIDDGDDKSTNIHKHTKIDSSIKEYEQIECVFSNNIEGLELDDNTFLPTDDFVHIYDNSEKNIEVSRSFISDHTDKQDKQIESHNGNMFSVESYDTNLDLIFILRDKFNIENNISNSAISFKNLTKDASRIDVSKRFFEVLFLATKNAISVEQKESYGDIEIKASENFFGNDMKILFEKDQGIDNIVKD
ncbi:hypothetical protein PORY_000667 [Pneumocystis oryctolagi]|uniref:Uncharacterized protein n=1 Tax=Pneumocystis oryctolagi TaxID=42067 RepID=A0ACB7CGK6_9ASCO|nr:hypothetical protein PORY_000667 [Pneumocystis oryctolagi]